MCLGGILDVGSRLGAHCPILAIVANIRVAFDNIFTHLLG